MNRDEEFLIKRIKDLAEQSYRTGLYTYTGFLNQQEQAVYARVRKDTAPVTAMFSGGVDGCERQILRFGDEESLGYDAGFPICCIEIKPLIEKFADALTHRDYLGALMHLGIERSTLGDIMIRDKTAYLFCLEKIAPFIPENLDQVKHTHVQCRILDRMPEAVRPKLQAVKLIVPSMRLDVIVGKALSSFEKPEHCTVPREEGVCQRLSDGEQQRHSKGAGCGVGAGLRQVYL